MAQHYEDRYRSTPFRGERGVASEERGFTEPARDEIRSWSGDEETERLRWIDEAERRREREADRLYRRDYGPYDYGWASEPRRGQRGYGYLAGRGWRGEHWESPNRWRTEPSDRDRIGAENRGWRDRDYAAQRYGYAGETGRDTSWSGPSSSTYGRYSDSPYSPRYDDGSSMRWREGGFTGRGPKGYTRSDSRIREDVCDRLTDSPDIDASDIEVSVTNGEVTLSGTVRHREDKWRSEDVSESVTGVREVHNHLRVSRWQEENPAPE